MNENYKNLLFAIFNVYTDEEKGHTKPIVVYDTKNDDILIAIFKNAKSCANFFKTSQKAINSSICRCSLRKNRYRLERIDIDEK